MSGSGNGARPTLERNEVLAKFRQRASAAEVRDFERLAAASNEMSRTRATEMVLFQLTTEELRQIGIAESKANGRYLWAIAVQYKPSAQASEAFERALKSIGVEPSGVMDLGIVGWSVPREQFFTARRALLNARMQTNEIRVIEPDFSLR